jgi:TolB-like protein/DNA-binding winged helix-turn-helix (wHTH) protein/Tfp pilus assembly protein PilF
MTWPDKELFEFDSFRLDPAEQLLLRDGQPVPLEPKVFETLLVLIRHGGRLVGKEELMREVWPDSFVEDSNLTRNISILRKALNRNDGGPQYIETVPKRGYRFVGEVQALVDARTELIVQSAKVSVVIDEEESDQDGSERGDMSTRLDGVTRTDQQSTVAAGWKQISFGWVRGHKSSVALSVLSLAAAAVAAAYFRPLGRDGQAIDSLAVLPFVNEGANPETEYLSDGITDSLINSLSQLPGLKVMSHNSVHRYKGREVDARATGKELGVRAMLTGRVVTRDDSLSITAELVDAEDNRHLWGEQYNRKLSDILAMQSEISRDISEKLRRKLSGADKQRLAKTYTENPEAYDLYLKGRYYMNTLTDEGLQEGLGYFQRAIEKDSRYGPAYAGLAESYTALGNVGAAPVIPPKEATRKAKAAALQAVELDETLAEAHTSLGLIAMSFEWDWNGAEREFRQAIALNPNYVNAHHWYSHYLINLGRFEESLDESRRALALDPLDVAMNHHLGVHYYHARQYDQAIAQLQKTLEMDRNHSESHTILGVAYEHKGMYDEAIAELKRGVELGGTDERGSVGHVYAISGKRGEAQKLLDQLQEESRHKYVSPYGIAAIYEGLGEKDHAFEWLEKAYAERDGNMIRLKVDPDLDSLHSDERFADLLRRIGLIQ